MARILAALAFALAALPAAALALTVDFDFRRAQGQGYSESSSLSFTDANSGLTLTVGAGTQQGSGVNAGGMVTRLSDGLGVRRAWYDRPLLDGLLGRDVLTFSFDRAVRIEGVRFAGVDGNDDARIFARGGNGGLTASGVIDLPGSGTLTTLASDSRWFGDLFGIGAPGWDDEFRIAGLRVSFEDIGDTISTTPLPGPLALLLGGFAALAASLGLRRRGARSAG